ncbi:response regulator [Paenibacillus turicensis]|uniref:response regulator n=1 Tax=Paenibacillus turicensis TaxID=160487 RepID=UPI003D270FF9
MINLMLVDDEERARTGIRDLIDWKEHNIEIVAEARDGLEALELLEKLHVDIILTDIRMPELDGLKLIEIVAQKYPLIKTVIMSGYGEFTYAQKALSLGASDYLLKPSRRQEILETIVHLTSQINEEQVQNQALEKLKKSFRETLPLLKEQTLSRLVTTESPPYQRLLETLNMNGITFPHVMYGVMIVKIDHFLALQQKYGTEDIELFKFAIKNMISEMTTALCPCAVFEYQDDIVVILNTEKWLDRKQLAGYIETIQRNTERYLKFTVSIGIGSFNNQIEHVRLSFLEASKALDIGYYAGTAKVVDYMDAVEEESSMSSYPLAEEKAVLKAVRHGEFDSINATLHNFNQALNPEIASKDQVLKSSFALFFSLYHLCIENNVDVSQVFGQDLTEMTSILARSSQEELISALSDTALKVSKQLTTKKNSNKLFENVLNYIKQNYTKNISREDVAREVYITPGYISLLFKQEMKTSFLDYLHKIRIDAACEKLVDQSLRIGDVAHDVGYGDEKYFYQVFKKYMGMTPNQYRNNLN